MPAAAEQTHGPYTPDPDADGAVIHLGDRAQRRLRRHSPAPDDYLDHLAHRIEALFNRCGRTLTDGETAETMAITMDSVLGLIDGARAEGVLEDAQHQQLRALLDGIRDAPSRL